ncbi:MULTISPECIES: shikimate dehydrogenase family protein [Ramlibacter]|uniref:Shikimate dehydrogenase n=1 Tax=Ramlibacter pinisoli TaxID=2682844 RepID=A0A6N8J031_9BURK|nr:MULTISPECIES: shikimate dehydrogenase [Ramlibacter]MBA2961660.1 shikimate dehydrogenase [Ramlibacter sp. CGMCC 1.13660]MVQ31603.1 shikimate dehydrogenase [Ramlibacter pinisoli]
MDSEFSTAWRRLSGESLLFPVIGHPVAQVRAPLVFNDLFARAGIAAVSFGLALPPERVVETCRALLASSSVGGLLVTVPYKKVLCAAADRLGADARVAGSLNALRRGPDGTFEGDLFDGTGFVRGLHAAGHLPAGRNILLLGAGGAGAAIAAKLGAAGAALVKVFDPQAGSAETLAARLREHYPGTGFRVEAAPDAQGCDIVINASPLGLRPEDPLPLDPARLAPGTLVCDIIMKPATTALLRAAQERGLPVHRGGAMLDHQVPAYLEFFGFADLARRVETGSGQVTLRPAAAAP